MQSEPPFSLLPNGKGALYRIFNREQAVWAERHPRGEASRPEPQKYCSYNSKI